LHLESLGSFVLVPFFSNYLKISDTLNGVLSLLGDITTCLLMVFSTSPTMFYFCKKRRRLNFIIKLKIYDLVHIAALTLILGFGIITVMNTLPSKLVPNNELGNIVPY